MAGDDQTAMLREAAKARGFKLVKSRRRKAGGDFGKYGLTDSKGRECFGFGEKGLTGDAAAVLAYLRGGETASWKRSLMGVVGGKEAAPAKADKAHKKDGAGPTHRARLERSRESRADTRAQGPRTRNAPKKGQADSPRERLSTSLGTNGESGTEPAALTIRAATPKDAKTLAKLLGTQSAALKKNLAALAKAATTPLVAERDTIVGVIAWATLPRLDAPPLARITTLFVAEDARREGIGTALLAAADKALKKAKVAELELLLDISLDAPAAFLRKTGWERSANAYRRGPD